jgi:hypothetical protein
MPNGKAMYVCLESAAVTNDLVYHAPREQSVYDRRQFHIGRQIDGEGPMPPSG